MKRAIPAVLLVLLFVMPGTAAEVCGVYENTGFISAEGGTKAPKVEITFTVPEGAEGIQSWQFASETPETSEFPFRLAARLKINGNLMNHWATFKVDQSPMMNPGGHLHLEPGDVVTVTFFYSNRDTVPRIVKGNAWVYFKMGAGY